jgi:phage-related protein
MNIPGVAPVIATLLTLSGIGGGLGLVAGMVLRIAANIGKLAKIASVMRALTIAWTAAQWLLNLAMRANPLGVLIKILGLAVTGAFILAYRRSETFRNIVDGALEAVGDVAQWLWKRVLQPIFEAWQWWYTDVLGPAVVWLWRNVIRPVFRWVGDHIRAIWRRVIMPVFEALRWWFREVIGPTFSWLWRNIIRPVMRSVGDHIRSVWRRVIQPVFEELSRFIRETVPNAFRRGVDAIEREADTAGRRRAGELHHRHRLQPGHPPRLQPGHPPRS